MNVANAPMAACEDLLFASGLQPSDRPNQYQVRAAIRSAARRYGPDNCASIVAAEYQAHSEGAAQRMKWVHELVWAYVDPLWALLFRTTVPEPVERRAEVPV